MAPCSFILFTLLTFSSFLHGISAVTFTVTNDVPEEPGGIRFEKEIGIPYTKQIMEESFNLIRSTVFEQKDPSEQKPIEFVNFKLVKFKDDSAEKDAIAFMGENNTLTFNCVPIEKYNYNGEIPWNLKLDFSSVMYHEMTHVIQWGGGGHANPGLQEGIAEYTKIKLKQFMQPTFAKPGFGNRWDEGYSITARFLEYCDEVTPGFTVTLHKKMRDSYDEAFFKELTGKPVDQLWKDYKAKYEGGGGGGGGGGNTPATARRLSAISSNLA